METLPMPIERPASNAPCDRDLAFAKELIYQFKTDAGRPVSRATPVSEPQAYAKWAQNNINLIVLEAIEREKLGTILA